MTPLFHTAYIGESSAHAPDGIYAVYGYEGFRVILGKMPLDQETLTRRADDLKLLALFTGVFARDLHA